MLDALKRMLGGRPEGPAWSATRAWAEAAGCTFKRTRDGQGFVVAARGWRLEAGRSQRHYIEGPELRVRGDVEVPRDLQLLVMSRALMSGLERATFEQFTDPLRTYADDSTPEEMRWLAMFGKLDAAALGALAPRFGAAAPQPAAVAGWLDGALAERLQRTAAQWPDEHPLVLMVNRARLTLRTECTAIDGATLGGWIALFETARDALPRAVGARRDG